MRVIITGVTSFLGINTARKLLQDGMDVIGIVRPDSTNLSKLVKAGLLAKEEIAADGTSSGRLSSHFHLCRFDFDKLPEADIDLYQEMYELVFGNNAQPAEQNASQPAFEAWVHFAWDGIGSAGRSDAALQERNIANARKAFSMARVLGVRKFLFAGSQAEYGSGTREQPKPVSEYGKAKLAFGTWAEEQSLLGSILGSSAMQFIHMRIYSVYGRGDHATSLVNTLLDTSRTGADMMLGPCSQQWNYLEIRDLANAVETLILSPDTRTDNYDIAGTLTVPLARYVKMIHSLGGGSGELHFGARGNNAEGAADMNPDTTKLESLGFRQQISFEQGIRELLLEDAAALSETAAPARTCIACGGELAPLLKLDNMPASAQDIPDAAAVRKDHGITLQLCQCRQCGLVQFDTAPVSYYKDVIRAGGGTRTMTLLRQEEYARLIRCMEQYHVRGSITPAHTGQEQTGTANAGGGTAKRHYKIIEVGCGKGEFIRMWNTEPADASAAALTETATSASPAALTGTPTDASAAAGPADRDSGMPPAPDMSSVEISGIEHSAALVKEAQAAGLRVTEGFAGGSFRFPGAPFDAFVQFNFLEHQPDPADMLRCIRRNLKDGGLGLVTVPSLEYILRHDGYYELIRDHIAYYTETTLQKLFQDCGFYVIDSRIVNRDTIEMIVQKVDPDSLSTICISGAPIGKKKGRHPQDAVPQGDSAGLSGRQLIDVTPLEENRRRLTADISQHLGRLRAEGRTLALWGAGHQGFTLAATTSLGGKVSYIIDSAEFKQGRFAPVSHIPIVSPAHFKDEPVDEILIVAPGYTDEIAGCIRRDFGTDVRILVLRGEAITEYK